MTDGNVVLFPFLAHGHLTPCLDLVRLLSVRYPHLTLTLVTTSGNLPFLRRLRLPPALRFAALPFDPSDHGLPPDTNTTFALPSHLVTIFNHAVMNSLPPHFRRLLSELIADESLPPLLCVIADMFLGWTAPVAEELGVFHATLYTSGPYAMSIYYSLWINLPHIGGGDDDEDDEIAIPGIPGVTVRRGQLNPKMRAARSMDHPSARFVRVQAESGRRSRATLWNTAEVIEKPFLDAWSRSSDQPVYAVGPLFSAAGRPARDDDGLAAECLAWLDAQAPRSVVYVSFGSQNRLPPKEAAELATALDKQGRPFLWAAPTADQAPPPPETGESGWRSGMVARGWVPQVDVLGHAAVGAFVSHGGWNSTLESLRFGVPTVVRPIEGEQFLNAKLLTEVLGAGAEAVGGKEVAEAVAEVMGEEERGRELRRRAREIAEGLAAAVAEGSGGSEAKGASLRALDEFVQYVMRHSGLQGEVVNETEQNFCGAGHRNNFHGAV
ncbi:crocetin glucosyltransferase 3-like [Canna indica]|uniref:Glycosyltransferase n=1 Tax=Canna indica TaxID=4628 RepID=A0AAQ3KD08_9LILI|nr:crocetin glucosyltransferase 3-like [Canna indica]